MGSHLGEGGEVVKLGRNLWIGSRWKAVFLDFSAMLLETQVNANKMQLQFGD